MMNNRTRTTWRTVASLLVLPIVMLWLYHQMVRAITRLRLSQLSEGNFEPDLQTFADEVTFSVAGDHGFGGRLTRDQMRQNFTWLYDKFDQQFEVHNIWVQGGPWNTVIAAHWHRHVVPKTGEPFTDRGMNFIRLKWGQLVEEHLIFDPRQTDSALSHMETRGIKDAASPPVAN